jgi:hypothetical protein
VGGRPELTVHAPLAGEPDQGGERHGREDRENGQDSDEVVHR